MIGFSTKPYRNVYGNIPHMHAYAAGGRLSCRSFRPLLTFPGGGAFGVRITVTRSAVRLGTRNKFLLTSLRGIDRAPGYCTTIFAFING
jgi:hypothetical protein